MLEEDDQTGASRTNPHENLKEEILMSLADWRQSYELDGMDFGGVVLSAVLKHIHRTDGIECRVQFTQFLARNADETLTEIVEVLRQDAKAGNRLH